MSKRKISRGAAEKVDDVTFEKKITYDVDAKAVNFWEKKKSRLKNLMENGAVLLLLY